MFSAIFTAAFIALYTNKFPGQLAKHLVPAVREAGLPESSIHQLVGYIETDNATAIATIPGMSPELSGLIVDQTAASWAGAYAYVYYFAIALGVLAFLAAVCLKDLDQYMTDHVPHQIYHKEEGKKDILDSSSDSESSHTITAVQVGGEEKKIEN